MRLSGELSLPRTGARPPRVDETTLRVLLWLAMIIGLAGGFALAMFVAAALSAQ